MPNVIERLWEALFPPKTPSTPYRHTTADLQRQPGYVEKVADCLERFGLKLEKQGRQGTHYLSEGNLSEVFRKDAARQPNDGRKQVGIRRFQEPDGWLR
jgi:hypothetical protein